MSTQAYPLMREVADGWENLYDSAVCCGIVGDQRHARQGGYHIARQDQSPTNYSVVRVDDRPGMGPNDAAAAIDMSLSTRDMVLCTRRLQAVWSYPGDPRRKYLNAFNGWLGHGDAIRFDLVRRISEFASPDHKSHIHLEVRRRWVPARSMVAAVLSALAGDTVAQYLTRIGVSAVPARPSARTATGRGPTVPTYPGRVLRRNDHQAKPDPAVATWQARMIARGWASIGTADGKFGPHTEDVVRRFQAVCRIAVDGEIGPVTWPTPWTQPLGG